MKLRNFLTSAALAGSMLVAGVATAGTVTLDREPGFVNGGRGGEITETSTGTTDKRVNAGKFLFTVTETSGELPVNFGKMLEAFCIEITQGVEDPATYEVMDAAAYFDADQLGRIAKLFNSFYGSTGTTATDAAFQVALWELIYDDDFNLSTGDFTATGFGTSLALAQSWLDAIAGMSGTRQLWVLVSRTSQDLIFLVPEPGTLALMGAGLMLVGFSRRRRVSH